MPETIPQPDDELSFTRAEKVTLKAVLSRPVTIIAIGLVVVIAVGIVLLEQGSLEGGLGVPEVSYALLPNEGRSPGVPVAVKLGQIAVFMLDDPLEEGTTGGVARAKDVVATLQAGVAQIVANPGRSITLDFDSYDTPAIVQSRSDGTDRKVLIQLTEADVELAGEVDAKRLSRLWAERLTDAIKLLGFGEPPKFTKGSEFGDALMAMHTAARAHGGLTSATLDQAFLNLPAGQQEALSTLPYFNLREQLAEESEDGSG